jgi:hypothetical protein
MPIVDQDGRLVAILAGHPADETWPDVSRQAAKALEKAGQLCSTKEKVHRRGLFSSLRCGVSYGGGQRWPKNLSADNPDDEKILAYLNQKVAFQRIDGFTNGKSPLSHFLFTAE